MHQWSASCVFRTAREKGVFVGSIFTRIIAGELPGQFVWKDDRAVAFMSIAPLKPGHALVVPRAEIDHWVDLNSRTELNRPHP